MLAALERRDVQVPVAPTHPITHGDAAGSICKEKPGNPVIRWQEKSRPHICVVLPYSSPCHLSPGFSWTPAAGQRCNVRAGSGPELAAVLPLFPVAIGTDKGL